MNTANKNGILFGLLCPGVLSASKGEPVAYLYNGVLYPVLPVELNEKAYPYAVIVIDQYYSSTNRRRLYCFNTKPTTYVDNGNYYIAVPSETQYFTAILKGGSYTYWEEGDYWQVEGEGSGAITIKVTDRELDKGEYGIVWANFVVTGNNGEILVPGVSPIPIYSLDIPVTHYCIYNGQKAPALPSLSASLFKNVLLLKGAFSDDVHLYASTAPLYLEGSYLRAVDNGYGMTIFNEADLTWTISSSGDNGLLFTGENLKSATLPWVQIVWSNFDVLNKDGTLYLAASEPIPVYE